MTPRTVRLGKLQAKRALAATFGIVPATVASSPVATLPPREHPSRLRASTTVHGHTLADFPDIPLEATRIAPTLTPRNAYQNPSNRQFVLAMRPPSRPRDSVSPRMIT